MGRRSAPVTRVRSSSLLPEPVAPTTSPCGPIPPCADSFEVQHQRRAVPGEADRHAAAAPRRRARATARWGSNASAIVGTRPASRAGRRYARGPVPARRTAAAGPTRGPSARRAEAAHVGDRVLGGLHQRGVTCFQVRAPSASTWARARTRLGSSLSLATTHTTVQAAVRARLRQQVRTPGAARPRQSASGRKPSRTTTRCRTVLARGVSRASRSSSARSSRRPGRRGSGGCRARPSMLSAIMGIESPRPGRRRVRQPLRPGPGAGPRPGRGPRSARRRGRAARRAAAAAIRSAARRCAPRGRAGLPGHRHPRGRPRRAGVRRSRSADSFSARRRASWSVFRRGVAVPAQCDAHRWGAAADAEPELRRRSASAAYAFHTRRGPVVGDRPQAPGARGGRRR